MAISVAIIEDDPVVSRYLSNMILGSPLCQLAGVAANKNQAETIIAANTADIYLVDLGLPDVSGIDLMRQIRISCPAAKSMVLSSLGDMRHVMQSIEAGASGYLLKDDQPDELIAKLISLHNGNAPISAGVAKFLFQKISQAQQAPDAAHTPNPDSVHFFSLTSRELEVLSELRFPKPAKQIAHQLNISYFTVNQHIRHIYRKLGVATRTAALDKAMAHGLL